MTLVKMAIKYKKNKCVLINNKDSIFKVKKWRIYQIMDIKEIGGSERKVFFLKNKKVKKPIQVEKDWLDRNTKIVKC